MRLQIVCLFVAQNCLSVSSLVTTNVHQNAKKPSFVRSPSAMCLYATPEPLAEEGTWQAYLDEETTGLIYYFDSETGESLWEPPTPTFPQVRLPRKKQRLAQDLRRRYRKARQEQEAASQPNGGKVQVPVQEKPKAQEPNWLEGIFDIDDSASAAPAAESMSTVTTAAPAERRRLNFFSGIFGVSSTEEKREEETKGTEGNPALTNGETVVKSEGRKTRGILESFAAIAKSVEVIEATTAEVPVVETKPEIVEEEEKIEVLTPKPIQIEMGSFILPHPAKVRWGGEDALFTQGRTFGVFDGVSGADKIDGIPLYSKTLADEMKRMVGTSGVSVQDMTRYLTEAANFADNAATGASTAVVASIGENGFLQALNIGDSYCMVIRNGKVTAKTREISHYWECPYQLSVDSPDRPKDGTKLNVELIPGDVIVMGSDGIFDNVSDDQLLDLIGKVPAKPAQLAKKICEFSRKQSLDRKSDTPYAKQAQRRGDQDYNDGLGGKVDDSSCVVVLVK